MPKYKCENQNCSLFDQVTSVYKSNIRIINGKSFDENDYCPDCKNKRKIIRSSGMTTMIAGTNDQELRKAKV